jgi:hypothetical protein
MKPLCFVLMPFGQKLVGGLSVNFDAIYAELIAPAITAAEMIPLRADEERQGGIIHKHMYERLVLCDYAVADLTGANANVFYELGIRHGTRPRSTVLVFAQQSPPPFDMGPVRALSYVLDGAGKVTEAEASRRTITESLDAARHLTRDSPLYELLQGFPELDHSKTDVFRERVEYSEKVKEQLRELRALGQTDRIRALEQGLGSLDAQEAGVLVDLLLTYRDAKALTICCG